MKNINNGEKVKLRVWEHDEDNEHDLVAELGGVVENGKVRKGWEVVYTSDEDDGSTSGKELKEKGYTLPEYHFVAEYGDVKSEPGPVLEVRGWVKYIVKKEATGEIMANRKYTLFLPDQNIREGETDGEGVIYERDLPAGNKYVVVNEQEE